MTIAGLLLTLAPNRLKPNQPPAASLSLPTKTAFPSSPDSSLHLRLQSFIAGQSGRPLVMEHHNQKKGGLPLHLHHNEDEWSTCWKANIFWKSALASIDSRQAMPFLALAKFPRAWAFVGNTSGRLRTAYAPAGKMEMFFAKRDKRGGAAYSTDLALYRACSMELLGQPLKLD